MNTIKSYLGSIVDKVMQMGDSICSDVDVGTKGLIIEKKNREDYNTW